MQATLDGLHFFFPMSVLLYKWYLHRRKTQKNKRSVKPNTGMNIFSMFVYCKFEMKNSLKR